MPADYKSLKITRPNPSGALKEELLQVYAPAAGTNTYTTSLDPVHILVEGDPLTLRFANANTGPSTVTINAGTPIDIVKFDGTPVASGDIKTDMIATLLFDGLHFRMPAGGGGGSGSSAFNDITPGTNTTAAMVVSTGASLTVTGTGVIEANELKTNTATPVVIDGSAPTHEGQILISQPGNASAAWADPFVQGVYDPGTNTSTGGIGGGPIKPVLVGGSDYTGTPLLHDLKIDSSGQIYDDVIDRADRLLGIVYGSQSQQLKQTTTNYNLATEIYVGGSAIDPRSIRALTSGDVVTTDQGTSPWVVSGGVSVTQTTSPWVISGAVTEASLDATIVTQGTAASSKIIIIGGKSNDGTAQYRELPLGTGGRSIIIEGFAGSTAVPVSGSVTTSGTVTATTNADTTIGSTTPPSKGLLILGKTADVTPVYDPIPLAAGGGSVVISGTVTVSSVGQGTAAASTAGWPVISGNVASVTAAWTSATADSTALPIATVGYEQVAISINPTGGTITGGTIIFEVSDDGGTTWYQASASELTGFAFDQSYALTASQQAWHMFVGGFTNARVRLHPQITGSGTINLRMQATAFPSRSTVAVGQATAANLNATVVPPSSTTASSTTHTSVSTVSIQVLAANSNRKEVIITNTGTTVIYLGLGATPTVTDYHVALSGCTNANDGTGSVYVSDIWKGVINAIGSGSTGSVVSAELT